VNIVQLNIPVDRRVAAKLNHWQTSEKFTAIIDVLADIRPRRTEPQGVDVIITGDARVFLARVDRTGEDRFHYIGSREDLEKNLRGLADAAKLTGEERSWLLGRVAEFTHEELIEEDVAT